MSNLGKLENRLDTAKRKLHRFIMLMKNEEIHELYGGEIDELRFDHICQQQKLIRRKIKKLKAKIAILKG